MNIIKSKSIQIVFFSIVFLLFLEMSLRMAQPYLSKDLNHYINMNKMLINFYKKRERDILFIGNSLTREGIDIDEFTQQNIRVLSIHPDDTTITEWLWLYKSKIYQKYPIDNLVIVFAGSQLSDKKLEMQNLVSIANLVKMKQLGDVCVFENLDFSDAVTLILSHVSSIFSSRERIQRRVLDLLPSYREQSRLINGMYKKQSIRVKDKKSYRHLKELIRLVKLKDTNLTLVAIPLSYQYNLDNKLLNICKTNQIHLIDGRNLKNISPRDFLDGYHLNRQGAKKFTKFLIKNSTWNLSKGNN